MQYQHTESVCNIEGFFILDKELYYGKRDGDDFYMLNHATQKKVPINGPLGKSLNYKGFRYVDSTYELTHLLNENNELFLWDPRWRMYMSYAKHSDFVPCGFYIKGTKFHDVYDLEHKVFLNLNLDIDYIINNCAFQYVPNSTPWKSAFRRIDLPTGKVLWEFSLAHIPWPFRGEPFDTPDKDTEVRRFIGIHKDILWVALTSAQILAINVNTGKEIYLGEVPDSPCDQLFILGELDERREIIFYFYYDMYVEFDLNSYETRITRLKTDADGYINYECWERWKYLDYDSRMVAFDEDYIYFTTLFKSWIGVISRETKKVVWTLNMKDVFNCEPDTIVVSDGDLYVKSLENEQYNLRIFKRMED